MTKLSFVNFHMQPYQRDTQQLTLEGHGAYFLLLQYCWTHGCIPLDDASRAAICKVSVARWRKELAPLVAGYFDANGENKRATIEIAKAERSRTRQAMAGHRGGTQSAMRKEIRKAMAQPPPSRGQAMAAPRPTHGEANKEYKTTTTEQAAARDPITEQVAGEALQEESSGYGSAELGDIMKRKGWVR